MNTDTPNQNLLSVFHPWLMDPERGHSTFWSSALSPNENRNVPLFFELNLFVIKGAARRLQLERSLCILVGYLVEDLLTDLALGEGVREEVG